MKQDTHPRPPPWSRNSSPIRWIIVAVGLAAIVLMVVWAGMNPETKTASEPGTTPKSTTQSSPR